MPKKLTTEEFIARAKEVHGDKYDYSAVKYVKSDVKVKVKCHLHGVWEVLPPNHIRQGTGCPKCRGGQVGDTSSFIEKAQTIHGDIYDYAKVDYVNTKQKVVITCGIHGDFEQTPKNHLTGQGCPKCTRAPITTEEFKVKLKERNPALFTDPMLEGLKSVQYQGARKAVLGLKCKKHGDIHPSAGSLLQGRRPCRHCVNEAILKEHRRKGSEALLVPWETQLHRITEMHPSIKVLRNIETPYKSVKQPFRVLCELCGREWSTNVNKLLSGYGCGCDRSKYRTEVGYLYILKTPYGSHKIGITYKVKARLQQLRRGAPKASLKPSVVHIVEFQTWDLAYKAEQALHQFYQGSHIDFSEEFPEGFDGSTEHFNLTPFQVNQATQLAEIMGGKLIK